ALTLNPSLALTVTGGVGTWWTFNVAKIAETIAEPVTLAGLAPVTTHLSWGAITGGAAGAQSGSIIGEAGVSGEQVASELFDDNPKVRSVVRQLIAAADFFGDLVTEVDAVSRRGGEFWGGLMSGDSLETAQADSEHVERLTREAPEMARKIKAQAAVLTGLAQGGVAGMSAGHLAKLLEMAEALRKDVNSLEVDLETLSQKYGADIPQAKIDALRAAAQKLVRFEQECRRAG
ncbi:MAG: hypothetical protein KC635_04495, partial [Myxococcales bacterium]|nr:hypothetical protein [Myxococcales bacterium]